MSYIENNITVEKFLDRIQNKTMREQFRSIYHQFHLFCKAEYNKTNKQVLDDLAEDWKITHTSNKIIIVLNRFVKWCLDDHPEITYYHGKYNHIKRKITAKHPRTIKLYVGKIRILLEDVWNIEVNSQKIFRQVKIPKPEEEEAEPFTTKQMRIFLDSLSNKKKIQFMVLKDTGMRIQEFCQIRKKDVDVTQKRVMITIQAKYTKTKRARICYITKETEPGFLKIYKSKDENELLFGTSEDPKVAKGSFQTSFAYYRDKISKEYPDFGEIYQSNGRHKKTIHSIRSYTSTQCTIAKDEAWGHEYIGHKRYLGQYIRDKDQFLEKFIRSENHLMIYEKEVVVEHDEEVNNIQAQLDKQGQIIQELLSINDEKINLLKKNNNLQQRITELELKIKP